MKELSEEIILEENNRLFFKIERERELQKLINTIDEEEDTESIIQKIKLSVRDIFKMKKD